jgi:hypothetical protein
MTNPKPKNNTDKSQDFNVQPVLKLRDAAKICDLLHNSHVSIKIVVFLYVGIVIKNMQ